VEETVNFDDVPGVPILLYEARGAYAAQIRNYVSHAGLAPLPVNGALVLGGLHEGIPFEQLVRRRKRSIDASQTIERLIVDGYLEGDVDAPVLTERGHEAAHLSHEAVTDLTQALENQLGERGMESFIEGMLFLISKKEFAEEPQGS
jgi:hypothetical protein